MESDEEDNTVNGRYPEYGAIFMSNRATKNECFSRKLFGLPAGEGEFVKQVKTGMLLFLFEFEKRELYGVFQASCDGAMNIVPSAYKKSGHMFPAQVKFNRIWHCHPLPEAEFGDAIKENYFSRWKFNRGLSKVQVRRLLILFSSRIMEIQNPQRALARKSVDTEDVDGELGDSKLASDKVANLHKWDNKLGSIISSGYPDDDKLESDKVSNLQNRDNEVGSIMSSRHLEDLPGSKVGRCDAKFAVVESIGNELNVDVEPGASTSIGFQLGQNGSDNGKWGSGGIVCCAGTPLCSGIPIQETDSSVQDQSRQASSPSHKMELPVTSTSYIASSAEAVVTGTLPYEPDNHGLNRPCSPSIGGNHSFIQGTDGHNGILSMRNQRQDNSVINYIPLPGEASNAEMEIDSSKSLAPESLSEFGSNASESKIPSSYPLIPSNYPSIVVNPDHSVALQNILVHEIAPFTADITTLTEIQCELQGQTLYGDHQSMDHHEHKCLDHKIFEGRLCSDLMENKGSVFSRLSLNSDAYVEDNTTHNGHEKNVDFALVDEVMATLNECRCERLCSHLEKLKAQKAVQSELEMIPKRFDMASAIPTEHEVGQQRDEIPFLDFKRRSQLRRVNCATNDESAESEGLLGGQCKRSATNDQSAGREGLLGGQCKRSATSDESAGNEGLLGGQRKRRKLIRPNFRKNEPCDNKISTGNCLMKSVKSLQSVQECSSFETDKSTEMEMLPEVVHCPNVNVPCHADAALVNNQHGSNNEQSSVSCNSNENKSPQEHESRNYMPSGMEFGNDDAYYDPVRENKRLWSILTAGLQRHNKAKPQ